jgi:DNA-binding GntR family transcriptional regulator
MAATPEETHVTIADRIFARAYGISRGPLREAIGRLEACSLVVRKPNVGARVVSLSAEQLLEIYHVREALEGMAARLAATAMNDAEIADLAALLSAHRQQVESDPSHGYFQKEGDLTWTSTTGSSRAARTAA